MNTKAGVFKQFKSDEVDLILLRLKLSEIAADFWLDVDGFFNYSLRNDQGRVIPLQKKSPEVNWTRIDEVISQLAYDASRIHRESAFSQWYNELQEDSEHTTFNADLQPQHSVIS